MLLLRQGASRPLPPVTARYRPLPPVTLWQVDGRIDQTGQLLLLNQASADAKRYAAMGKWAAQLGTLQQTILAKVN